MPTTPPSTPEPVAFTEGDRLNSALSAAEIEAALLRVVNNETSGGSSAKEIDFFKPIMTSGTGAPTYVNLFTIPHADHNDKELLITINATFLEITTSGTIEYGPVPTIVNTARVPGSITIVVPADMALNADSNSEGVYNEMCYALRTAGNSETIYYSLKKTATGDLEVSVATTIYDITAAGTAKYKETTLGMPKELYASVSVQ